MAPARTPDAPPPVVVRVDTARKILRIGFQGHIRPEHIESEIARVQEALPLLGHGFVLVTDLSGLDTMELDCVVHVARLMDISRDAGVGKVIRIIPDPDKDIGFNLLSLVHYRGKVPTATCETKAEAEKELARE